MSFPTSIWWRFDVFEVFTEGKVIVGLGKAEGTGLVSHLSEGREHGRVLTLHPIDVVCAGVAPSQFADEGHYRAALGSKVLAVRATELIVPASPGIGRTGHRPLNVLLDVAGVPWCPQDVVGLLVESDVVGLEIHGDTPSRG